jgi:hypothetical protein
MVLSAWITRGFEAFRRGRFGNGGHNLYVSRAGVLQRVHLFDLNQNGHLDLVFCNSQSHRERVPAYVYANVLGAGGSDRVELPSDGAVSGAVADLTGDGFDDLVLACFYNGISPVDTGVNSLIYFGSRDGWSERHHQRLPTPQATSVAVGDFNGDGRVDLALACRGRLRIFYQSQLGFEPKRFFDLDVAADQLAAHDLDGDGCCDLVVRSADGSVVVHWGGPEGITADGALRLANPPGLHDGSGASGAQIEYAVAATPLVRVLEMSPPHVFVAREHHVELMPIAPARRAGDPIRLECVQARSVAAGDLRGPGSIDLVVAGREPDGHAERSWIYWACAGGYDDDHRTPLPSHAACDVAVGDLDDDGRAEILLCRQKTATSYTTESLIHRVGPEGALGASLRLESHDARRVFAARPDASARPQVAFVNHFARTCVDDVKATICHGGSDGFSTDRCEHLDASGAVEVIGCDLNDDGRPTWCSATPQSTRCATRIAPPSSTWPAPRAFRRDPQLSCRRSMRTAAAAPT